MIGGAIFGLPSVGEVSIQHMGVHVACMPKKVKREGALWHTPCVAHHARSEVGNLLDGGHLHHLGLGAVHAPGSEVLGVEDGLAGVDPRPLINTSVGTGRHAGCEYCIMRCEQMSRLKTSGSPCRSDGVDHFDP